MSERPNILLITSDQHRADHLGVKGMDAIATPALDQMATEGVHFDRAYTPSPICTPARVSLLTGQYPSRHGAWSIGVTVDPFPRPTLADRLATHGYATALYGKTHFVRRADEPSHVTGHPDPPPELFHTFDGPYLGFEQIQACRGHTVNAVPDMHYLAFLERAGVDYTSWFPKLGDDYDHWQCGSWNIPAQYHDTEWVTGLTEDFIHGRASSEAPWFCMANYQDPHEPMRCPEPWFSRVDPARLQLLEGGRPGEFDDKPAFYEHATRGDWGWVNDGCGVPSLFHNPAWDDQAAAAMQATVGMVGFLDHGVGRLLAALEASGQADNTVIIYTSDHGEMHGHHGFWAKGLAPYDDSQRVPLLLCGAGIEAVGTTQALANLVDLPGTILQLVGADVPDDLQGVDLTPVLQGAADRVQDHTLIECRATASIYQQTLITAQHKLIMYEHTDEGELYDLAVDPDQYHNLWREPALQSVKAELLVQFVHRQMAAELPRPPRVSFA